MKKSAHTDIRRGGLFDRLFPKALRPYARLMRLDRPIGTWLLFLPCLWGVTLASNGMPSLSFVLLFAVGSVIMRGAGCVVNDMIDCQLDAMVERTRCRPLPSGELTLHQAFFLLLGLMTFGLLILLQFNSFTIRVGIASLLLVFIYPLAKRVTWWPQLVLGFTFNWGALMGWSSIHGSLNLPAFVLYGAGIFWTLAYDTIYAHQDKDDDAIIGVKSLALYLGDKSILWISLFFALCLALLALVGYLHELELHYYAFLLLPAAHALWQLKTWKIHNPPNCLGRFKSNRDFGLLVFLALLMGKVAL